MFIVKILVKKALLYRDTLSHTYLFPKVAVCLLNKDEITSALRADCLKVKEYRNRIYFVAQKGATFELENPNVPVLFDFGRYLFVDLPTDEFQDLKEHDHGCWHIEELANNRDLLKAVSVNTEFRLDLDFVFEPNTARLKGMMNELCKNRSRYTFLDGYAKAAKYSSTILKELGFTVNNQEFSINSPRGSGVTFNTIAMKKGSGTSAKQVLICAHLDSINIKGTDLDAPGADDNASGVAALLEIAMLLSKRQYENDLCLVIFGGEELGLFGSKTYVEQIDENTIFSAILNMDMVGRNNQHNHGLLIEGHEVSKELVEIISQLAVHLTDLEVKTSLSPYASDHVPFIEKGLPAFLTIEGSDSSNKDIHTERDKLSLIDYTLMSKIIQVNTTFAHQFLVESSPK